MYTNKLTILLIITLITTSCSISTSKIDTQKTIKKVLKAPKSWNTKTIKDNNISTKWIKSFNDPIMLKLIQKGKANNNDLKIAAANMNIAWLLAKQSGAALKPTVDLSLGTTQSGKINSSSSSSNNNIGLTVSWEADVWGRIQAGVDAATANAQAIQADYTFAKQSLSANIAKTYLKIIDAKLQAKLTRKNLEILKKTMRITQVKYDNGISSGEDIALNRANLASAKEQLIKIESSKRDALRALDLLLGHYPDAKLEIPNILPTLPPQPPADIPSQILERRPDIISAERKIASAFNATSEAKAARLPRFSLTSSINGASNSLSDILNPANVAWQLGVNLLAPLYDAGKRKIDVEIANVKQKQAISSYVQVALIAFSDVEENLDHGGVLANRKTALSEVLKQSQKAYRIAEFRYKEGEIGLLDTLQIQQQAISAESNLISIKRLELEQRINLYLSLGGSW